MKVSASLPDPDVEQHAETMAEWEGTGPARDWDGSVADGLPG